MSEAGQKPEGKGKPTFELDVIGERKRIIPVLGKFLTLNPKDPLDEQVAIAELEELINSLWKTSPREVCDNFLAGATKGKIENRRLSGKNIGSYSNNIQLIASLIFGPDAFRGSTHAEIKNSLIAGPNAVRGSNVIPLLIPNRPPLLIPRDTYLVEITNSIIYGRNALSNVKGGIIKDSIIAGPSCLTDANVKIFNSWVINESGATSIADQVLGHPERYQIIPH